MTIAVTFVSFVFFLIAGTAAAVTFTTISDASPPEISLLGSGGILDQLYGLGILQRVDDDGDRTWFPVYGNATVMAKYADYGQNFGYIPDLNSPGFADDSFISLFTVSGNGLNLNAPTATLGTANVPFLWALDPSGSPLWTSLPSQNSDGLDHMTTWRIIDRPNTWVIAWEDLVGGGDRDFNDLVVEVGILPLDDIEAQHAPIPATVLLFGSGLVGLAGFRRKRFKKK